MKIFFHPYLRYKFFNSLFTGAVGGSVFTVYGSLTPSTFSIGGILLALGLMGMAYFYHYFMKIEHFFRFSLVAELIMLLTIVYFLAFPSHILTALIVYGAYQLSFMFGGYLVRAETHFARHARIMGWIDVVKQQGYLTGLTLSYLFYKLMDHYGISDAHTQVYYLHLPLFFIEIMIIVLLLRGFKRP